MNQDARFAGMIGKAGEMAVAAQLILRKQHVYIPLTDYGVDLMTETGCRIQVKSAHVSSSPKMIKVHGEAAYAFPLPKTKRVAVSNRRSVIKSRPKLSDVCDVIVFWGIEQNRFWIAPSHLCNNVGVVVLGKTNVQNKFVGAVEDLREMVRLGYTHQEIANKYGMHRASITMILNNPDITHQNPSAVSLVRQCENAWENIINFDARAASQIPAPETASEEITQ